MQVSGTVVDQATGTGLPGVQVWEISADGQSASVVGMSGPGGKYSVEIDDPNSTVNYAVDGYTGLVLPADQAAGSGVVFLERDGSVTAKLTLSNIPAWVWVVLAAFGIFYLGDGKKQKR